MGTLPPAPQIHQYCPPLPSLHVTGNSSSNFGLGTRLNDYYYAEVQRSSSLLRKASFVQIMVLSFLSVCPEYFHGVALCSASAFPWQPAVIVRGKNNAARVVSHVETTHLYALLIGLEELPTRLIVVYTISLLEERVPKPRVEALVVFRLQRRAFYPQAVHARRQQEGISPIGRPGVREPL